MATRTLTDTARIAWAETPAGAVSADVVDGSITPAKLAETYLTAAAADALFLTPVEGDTLFLTPAEGNAAYQPLDADLTAIGGLSKALGNIIVGNGSTWISRHQGQINALDYGVTADGTTDDTTAMQNAINAAIALDRPLLLPFGSIKISTLAVSSPICMIGCGHVNTVFLPTNTTAHVIEITCIEPVEFKDFGIDAQAITMTNGAGIHVTHASDRNLESQFTGLRVIGTFYGILFDRAAYWTMDRCVVSACKNAHVYVRNAFEDDEGDSCMSNCLLAFFDVPTSNNILLFQESSGGLKLHGNKFLGGHHGYHLGLAAGAQTLGPIITGNSFENQTAAAIFMGADNEATSLIARTVITGNEIASFGNGHGIQVGGAVNANWCRGITISGNNITVDLDAAAASSARGITANFCSNLAISGNCIRNDGAVGTTVGIELGSNVSLVSKGFNSIIGFNTAISDASTSPQNEILKGGIQSASPSQGVGYTTGAGGAVTQLTNKDTAVTLNTLSGQITMNATAGAAGDLTAGQRRLFQVNNTQILADDHILVSHMSGGANAGHYLVGGRGITPGASFVIDVKNTTAGTLNEALVLKFTIIRGANS